MNRAIAGIGAVDSSEAQAAVEFIGSKQGLLPFVMRPISEILTPGARVADIFAGTGSVSAALKSHGATVDANDHLFWCSTVTRALLETSQPPDFSGLTSSFTAAGGMTGYQEVLAYLNSLPGIEGFVARSYSPISHRACGIERRYFTEENACRIDVIRSTIAEWSPVLTQAEEALLISDLLRASSQVSNVAGTYGCYLKQWKPRALSPLRLEPAKMVHGPRRLHTVHCMDAERVTRRIQPQIVYADPPYTKRQYAAYYHVLETIALGDQPTLTGSTGLRPWREKASDWCYKRRAPDALRRLLGGLNRARHFFLSYNADGQIEHEEIISILRAFGDVRVYETKTRRYRSSRRPHRGADVVERLYHVSFSGMGMR